MKKLQYLSLWVIVLTLPLLLWAVIPILPTFDDWNTLSSPNYDPQWWIYVLPKESFWRPFDAMFGYIVATYYHLFPTLQHVFIVIGHAANAALVFMLCRRLSLSSVGTNIATLFFYISPCVLATLFACDSLNQTYSQFWGLVSLSVYLNINNNRLKYPLWAATIFLAALSKENGLAWAVIPPILAFGFNMVDKRQLKRDLLFALAVVAAYAVIRLSLPHTGDANTEYTTFLITKKIREIGVFVCYTWFSADYISLLHAPSRNLTLFILTLAFSLPFVIHQLWHGKRFLRDKKALSIVLCIIIAESPHLVITLSIMNAYAALSIAALLTGYLVSRIDRSNLSIALFALYVVSTLFTDIHHWKCSYDSGLVGRRMAVETVRQSTAPADSVFCITIDDDTRGFSSFCVTPAEAYGWGLSVLHENAYEWPKHLKDTIIDDRTIVKEITRQAFKSGYESVWIAEGKNITVVERSR